jgi:hypothetical protein
MTSYLVVTRVAIILWNSLAVIPVAPVFDCKLASNIDPSIAR